MGKGLGTGDWRLGGAERDPEAQHDTFPAPTTPGSALGGSSVTRRRFFGAAAASVAAMAISRRAESLAPSPQSPSFGPLARLGAPQPIGIQLYTVRDLMQKDVQGTLKQIAAIGYREIEFAGLFDKKPETVAKWLKEDKLTSPSSHIPLDRLKKDLQGVVDEARTLGNTIVVCPWVDESMRKTADDWRKIAADLNKAGEGLQRAGFQLAYHNHDFEFAKLPTGEMGYDILLKDCDQKLVKMELDLFWITKGGQDPLAYFAKWPGRFPCVHVKDMNGKGDMVNVGEGRIDWPKIFAKRREAGIEHFFVERDNARSLEDVKVSYMYLARLGL
jgi:sugar phosphate isomerase/epimerase